MSRRLAFAALIAAACAAPGAQTGTFDPEAPGSRSSRRDHLLAMAAKVRTARAAGRSHEALTGLRELLQRRDAWKLAGDPAADAAVAAEVTWATSHITREIDGFVRTKGPAAARVVAKARQSQLGFADFAALWPALDGSLTAADTARCQRATTPYLAALLAEDCARAGIEVARAPLPHAVGGMTIDGAIEGMTPAQREELTGALERGLAATAWYQRSAEARAAVTVGGQQSVTDMTSREMVEVPWYERVPYSTTKTATGSSSNGDTVTIRVPATEYREEERWLRYEATRHEAEYRGDWKVSIAVGPKSLAVRVSDRLHRIGRDHDVTHVPAGVTPTRADLPTADDWSRRLLGSLEPMWRSRLIAHWAAAFCEETEYTAETAARCALGAQPPPEARRALVEALGSDVDLVLTARADAQ